MDKLDLIGLPSLCLGPLVDETLHAHIASGRVIVRGGPSTYTRYYHFFAIVIIVCELLECFNQEGVIYLTYSPNRICIRVGEDAGGLDDQERMMRECSDGRFSEVVALLDLLNVGHCSIYRSEDSHCIGFEFGVNGNTVDEKILPFLSGVSTTGKLLLCLLAHPTLTLRKIDCLTQKELRKMVFDLPCCCNVPNYLRLIVST